MSPSCEIRYLRGEWKHSSRCNCLVITVTFASGRIFPLPTVAVASFCACTMWSVRLVMWSGLFKLRDRPVELPCAKLRFSVSARRSLPTIPPQLDFSQCRTKRECTCAHILARRSFNKHRTGSGSRLRKVFRRGSYANDSRPKCTSS